MGDTEELRKNFTTITGLSRTRSHRALIGPGFVELEKRLRCDCVVVVVVTASSLAEGNTAVLAELTHVGLRARVLE